MAKNKNDNKRGGRHTTLIDAAEKLVKFISKQPEVNKISPGFIKAGIRGAQQRIKLKDINGGLCVVVRGSTCIQELNIYSQDPKSTKHAIENFLAE